MEPDQEAEDVLTPGAAAGVGVGIGTGVALGAITGSWGMSLAFGAVMSAILGYAFRGYGQVEVEDKDAEDDPTEFAPILDADDPPNEP